MFKIWTNSLTNTHSDTYAQTVFSAMALVKVWPRVMFSRMQKHIRDAHAFAQNEIALRPVHQQRVWMGMAMRQLRIKLDK